MQTWFDFEKDITVAAIDQWRDHLRLCACWWCTLWARVHLYNLLECVIKLSM